MAAVELDILGLGVTSVDDLVYVAAYPPADAKAAVLRRERCCGGLVATALVAASRLGSRCAFAGALGRDELSQFVLDTLQGEGIDITRVVQRDDTRPCHSIIVVDQTRQTRNIFFDLNGVLAIDPQLPAEEVIRSTRVLFVDHVGMKGAIRSARIARGAGIPVVADLERDEDPGFPELLGLIDHVIVSNDFASKITGKADPTAAAGALWGPDRKVVVVTCGAGGCWYISDRDPQVPVHQPVFKVKVVDTTGCGDVFHGAYASGLARGLDVPARIRLASATAALKCTRRGGQAGIPTLATVERFLKERD